MEVESDMLKSNVLNTDLCKCHLFHMITSLYELVRLNYLYYNKANMNNTEVD